MSKPVFWSFSALSMFENCKRKYWAVKIAKVVSDLNQYNVSGDDDHKRLEHYMKQGLALPAHLQGLKPLFDRIKEAPGTGYVEYAMCLKEDFTPTRFKDFAQGWVRGAADYVKINGPLASYFDWKSGKARSGDEVDDQIDLTALLLFRHFPEVQQVNGGLVYYNHGKIHPHIVRRADEQRLWNGFLSRQREMVIARDNDDYPPSPNPLCGWCPHTACQYNTMAERLAREAAKAGAK